MICSKFSLETRRYLCRFYQILDEMIAKMTGAELTCSISRNFIVQMIPHHETAIQMSCNLLEYSECAPVREIAQNIIEEQAKSIENMQDILDCCSMCRNSQREWNGYQECFCQISQRMFRQMRAAVSTDQIDANFMREMIPHHEGAIRMSENVLRYPICPELIPILQAIVTSQRRGVRQMEQLLRCFGA